MTNEPGGRWSAEANQEAGGGGWGGANVKITQVPLPPSISQQLVLVSPHCRQHKECKDRSGMKTRYLLVLLVIFLCLSGLVSCIPSHPK